LAYRPGSRGTGAVLIGEVDGEDTCDGDVIRNHLVPAFGSVELTALRPSHIQSLYTRLLGRLSARSVLRYHQILHAALRQAVRWQLLVRNRADAVEPPRPGRRGIRALTPEQARAVMTAADGTPLGSFVRLALLTGMRRGELLGLGWAYIEGASIHLQHTAQRSAGQGIVFRQPKTRL
jgi:integrase